MLDVFPPIQQPQIRAQMSTSLIGIASQNLVPKLGGGRCCAMEIMVNTPAMGNLIREGKTSQIYSQIQMGAKLGMRTMEMALSELFKAGKVSWEAAMGKSGKPDELERLIGPAPAGTGQVKAGHH
jgi:twitching motility protein PilT